MGVLWTPDSGEAPFGNLGRYFYIDPEGRTGWDVADAYGNPAYALRIVFDDGRYLRSPYSFGKKRQQWGKKASEVPDEETEDDYDDESFMSQFDIGFHDDDDEEEDYYYEDEIPDAASMSLEDRLRWNYERLPDKFKRLAARSDLSQDEATKLLDRLVRNVVGDTGGLGTGGVLVDPFGGDPRRTVLWNGGPHVGFSVIGVPHGLYSIPQAYEMKKKPGLDYLLHKDFVSSGDEARRVSAPGNAFMSFEEYPALAHDTVEKLRDILPDEGLRKRLEGMMSKRWLNGYIPSANVFGYNTSRISGESDDYWKDYMYDNIVSLIRDTLNSSAFGAPDDSFDKFRVVQAAVKLSDLVRNDVVRRGEHSGQRDGMNELIVLDYVPHKDFGGAKKFIGYNGKKGLIDKYQELRRGSAKRPPLRAEEAWQEAFTDKKGNFLLGDIRRLISDEDKKNVINAFRDDIDKYCSRQSIVSGLTRGPGNS